MEHKITAVIPAHNEEASISRIVHECKKYVDEILVINDFSQDNTAVVAKEAGARVLSNKENLGYINSIKRGFKEAKGDIIVTLDADGEHDPTSIPNIVAPIIENKADLVLGKRPQIARISERFLNFLVGLRINTTDTGTGFRALKKDIAIKLNLRGKCICGIFDLEALDKGARIMEVPIKINKIKNSRNIAWFHFLQFFYVLKHLIKP